MGTDNDQIVPAKKLELEIKIRLVKNSIAWARPNLRQGL